MVFFIRKDFKTSKPNQLEISNYLSNYLKVQSDEIIQFQHIAADYLYEIHSSGWYPCLFLGEYIFFNNETYEIAKNNQIHSRCKTMFKLTKEKSYIQILEKDEKDNLNLFFPLL